MSICEKSEADIHSNMGHYVREFQANEVFAETKMESAHFGDKPTIVIPADHRSVELPSRIKVDK